MKHLIMLYATYNNGTADKKAIYEADNKDDAIASFHGYLNTYMKDKTVSMVTVIVMQTNGSIVRSENFIRTITVEEAVTEEVTE